MEIIKKLNAAGVKNQLITLEGAGHTPIQYMNDFEVKIANFLDEIIKKKLEIFYE